MPLTTTAAFDESAKRADTRWIILVDIYDGATHWKALSADPDSGSDLYGTPAAIQKVEPVGIELDPLTREVQSQEIFIDCDRAWLGPIYINNQIKKQQVTVKCGTAEIDEADYITLFTGAIEDVFPEQNFIIRLSVLDIFEVLVRAEIVGYWPHMHPLHALYNSGGVFDGIFTKAGVAAAQIDTAAFDPTTAVYDGDISHFSCMRGPYQSNPQLDGSVRQPTSALQLANEVSGLLYGHLVTDEDGKLTFLRFDASKSADTAISKDDILEGSFKQLGSEEHFVNRFVGKFFQQFGDKQAQFYQIDETTSQSDYAYPGMTKRILSYEFSTKWLSGRSIVQGNMTDAQTTMRMGSVLGFSGAVQNYPNETQVTDGAVSVLRPSYWLIVPQAGFASTEANEVVKLTADYWASLYSHEGIANVIDPEDGSKNQLGPWLSGGFSCGNITVIRAQLDTLATAHTSGSWLFDITVLVKLANEILARFKDGCPIIELSTDLSFIEYQIGDFWTITYDEFIDYGTDGLDGTDKFEVIGKEYDFFSDPPAIKWTLAAAGTGAVTSATIVPMPIGTIDPGGSYSQSTNEDISQKHVVTGLTVTDGGGLTATLAAGRASMGIFEYVLNSATNFTMDASKDNYITCNVVTKTIVIHPLALGAAAPTYASDEIPLSKVVTGAAAIDSIDNTIGETKAVDGSKLLEGTGVLAYLNSTGGYTDFDQVNDGSTYKKLTGVSATNEATSDSYEDSSVGTTATYDQKELTQALNLNPCFSEWKEG